MTCFMLIRFIGLNIRKSQSINLLWFVTKQLGNDYGINRRRLALRYLGLTSIFPRT